MKRALRQLLETPTIGRPLRKSLWFLMKLTEKCHWILATLFAHQPYVKKLNRDHGYQLDDQDRALVRYYEGLRGSVARLKYQPKISVLIPVHKVRTDFLQECLASLAAQIYSNWEACIIDDASEDLQIDAVISAFARRYPDKVRYGKNPNNLEIILTTNKALELATGDFVALLGHDDRLLPNALGEVVRFINIHNNADIFYSDECIIDTKGTVLETYHKPDWSPVMHLSVNYTAHLSIYRRVLLNQIGGCRQGLEGAQDYDMMMRAVEATSAPVVHIPINIYQSRTHELSAASSSLAAPDSGEAGIKAVTDACERRSTPADVSFEPMLHHYKVRFKLPAVQPLISIIIPTRDGYQLVKPCIDTVFNKSSYRAIEVILVDHDSQDPDCLRLFAEYEQKYGAQFRRISYRGPFNFAVMNNMGVRESRGDYLVFLNNDTEVVTPDWLEELLAVAQLPGIAAVGPKLLYPNQKIQHAGVRGAGFHIAIHTGLLENADTSSYFGYLQTTHEVMAVTGACLMIQRAKFEAVGGLEEVFVPNGYGDVDLCLKLRKAGYSNIYVPYAVLIHKESVTRKATFELFERYYMHRQWAAELMTDPYRHIAFQEATFKAEQQFRIQEPSAALFTKMMAASDDKSSHDLA